LPNFEIHVPHRLARIPIWLTIGGVLVLATVISAVLRSRYLSGQFWMDEALSVGISSHSLSSIPTVLRHDGSPPLYYLILHVWMSVFGSSESATHTLSLLFGLLTVPAGAWAAWSLFGRWAAVIAGVLFALNPFLTAYSQETRMYTLMTLLGLLASTTAGLVLVGVRGAKSQAKVSMRTELSRIELIGPAASLTLVRQAADDLAAVS